jgi:hexokinase
MLYEVDITIAKSLDEKTERLLEDVRSSANRLLRFRGDSTSIKLTVEVAATVRDEAIRAAAREVAAIFPSSDNEKYSEPRPT